MLTWQVQEAVSPLCRGGGSPDPDPGVGCDLAVFRRAPFEPAASWKLQDLLQRRLARPPAPHLSTGPEGPDNSSEAHREGGGWVLQGSLCVSCLGVRCSMVGRLWPQAMLFPEGG